MAKKLILSEQEKALLLEDYQAGMSLRQLEKKYHHTRQILSKLLRAMEVNIRDNTINSRKYYHNEDFFHQINTEEKAYWLGFFYADGFIEAKRQNGNQKFGITLKAHDDGHLSKFLEAIEGTNPIKYYKGSGYCENGEYARVLMTSQKTVDDLKDKGVVEEKTLKLKFPTTDIVPKELMHHFIRGYFDGDGSLSYWTRNGKTKESRNYLLGFTGMKDVLYGILKHFGKTNIVIRPHNNAFEVNIGGNQQLKTILRNMYNNAHVYLDRKKDIYDEFLKYTKR